MTLLTDPLFAPVGLVAVAVLVFSLGVVRHRASQRDAVRRAVLARLDARLNAVARAGGDR